MSKLLTRDGKLEGVVRRTLTDEISLGFYSGQYLEQQNEQPKAE
jgi:hypothetical protein